MKIDLKDNSAEDIYVSREFPQNYKFAGEKDKDSSIEIFIKKDTLFKIEEYLSGDLNNELGGVLLGDVCINSKSKKFVLIDNIIIAKHSTSSLSRLTFTHETWDYINVIKEKEFSDRKILGWFHSHPGHTVFLSNFDLFIHENFFNMEYMVAYVFDPTIKDRGFFNWKDGKIVKSNGFYVSDSLDNDYANELLPIGNTDELLIDDLVEKPQKNIKLFSSKKSELNSTVLISLLFLALLVLLFMIYNIYEIKQKVLLKEEYQKDLSEIRNENKILSERLNNLISEAESKIILNKNIPETTKNISESLPDEKEIKKTETNPSNETSSGEKVNTEIVNTEKISSTPEVTIYKVKNGDTLEKISNLFYKSRAGIEQIMKQNNIKNRADIKIGQQLEIPASLQ